MCDSKRIAGLLAPTWEEKNMVTLFWCSVAAMAALLVARWVIPAVAPDTKMARGLTTLVALELDEDSDEDVSTLT